eukprot:719039-Hanusia_phi.AAC.1
MSISSNILILFALFVLFRVSSPLSRVYHVSCHVACHVIQVQVIGFVALYHRSNRMVRDLPAAAAAAAAADDDDDADAAPSPCCCSLSLLPLLLLLLPACSR